MGRPQPTTAELEAPSGLAVRLRDVPFSDPRETLRAGCALVSQHVGLIRALPEGVYRAQDPRSYTFGILSADLYRVSDILSSGKAGGGGISLIESLAATIGETVERYCMVVHDRRRAVFGSYREFEGYAVAPDEIRLHSREQVERWGRANPASRLRYFDEDTPVHWVWGWSLTADRPRLVPAEIAYVGFCSDQREPLIAVNASSGLAAALTLEEAVLSGLYEVVERDAATISWMHRRVQRRIEVDEPELVKRLDENFQAFHPDVDLAFFDLTLDIPITTLFAVLRRPTEFGPALAVGAATRLDPRAATHKCLSEIGQSFPYFRYLLKQLGDWQPRDDFADLTSFDLHCMLYLKRPQLISEALSFCDEVALTIPLSMLPDGSSGALIGDLRRCLDLVAASGHEVIVVDLTAPDVAEAGFRAVRVIVPGLVPLHGAHGLPYLGVHRLHSIPNLLGWDRSGSGTGFEFNPFPHPYP